METESLTWGFTHSWMASCLCDSGLEGSFESLHGSLSWSVWTPVWLSVATPGVRGCALVFDVLGDCLNGDNFIYFLKCIYF